MTIMPQNVWSADKPWLRGMQLMFLPSGSFTDLKMPNRGSMYAPPATRFTMDDFSYYLGRLVCSLALHSCEDTEALLSVGHVAFWVLLGVIGVGAWRFSSR